MRHEFLIRLHTLCFHQRCIVLLNIATFLFNRLCEGEIENYRGGGFFGQNKNEGVFRDRREREFTHALTWILAILGHILVRGFRLHKIVRGGLFLSKKAHFLPRASYPKQLA